MQIFGEGNLWFNHATGNQTIDADSVEQSGKQQRVVWFAPNNGSDGCSGAQTCHCWDLVRFAGEQI